jgi:magnesium-transporting ATPase (P-type)
VLGFAEKRVAAQTFDADREVAEADLVFLGLAALQDPLVRTSLTP